MPTPTILDDWELLYFGGETNDVATDDGDGYLNWQEYILADTH